MSEILPSLTFFIRMVLLISFSLSFFAKVKNIALFDQAVANFQLLPQRLNQIFSRVFLAGELGIVICLVLGRNLLLVGFSLSVILVSIFSIALITVLIRKLQISCNCFGSSENAVSIYDVWRNVGLIVFALLGWGILDSTNNQYAIPTLIEGVLTALMAVAFSFVWLHLADIVHIFKSNPREHQHGNYFTD